MPPPLLHIVKVFAMLFIFKFLFKAALMAAPFSSLLVCAPATHDFCKIVICKMIVRVRASLK